MEAYKKGFHVVKIIHGKGIGVQKETVKTVLENTEFVKSFKSAPEFLGSWGATIVSFKWFFIEQKVECVSDVSELKFSWILTLNIKEN